MEIYRGISVLDKIAVGKIFFYNKSKGTPYKEEIEDVTGEIARFEKVCEAALAELDILFQEAAKNIGEEEAEVFAAHRMLVQDPIYLDYIRERIRSQRVNAEYAVSDAQAYFVRMFMEIDDEFMRGRAYDVSDVSERLLRLLSGEAEQEGPKEPCILVADELVPSETIRFDKSMILAFVVKKGSPNSHTAILARSMNIPAILGVDVQEDWDGRTAVADGESGRVILDPDGECLKQIRDRQDELSMNEKRLRELRGRQTVTKSGRKINLYANIGDLSEIDSVLENDAEGIGLFRSEFLYLQTQTWPTQEEQFTVYRSVAEAMKGKKVVIRTLDAGADKQLPYLDLPEEDNLTVGYRGVRVCLDDPEMFRTQLKAVLMAAVYGSVSLMFPMVVSVEEIRACKRQLEMAKTELRGDGIPYGEVETGIMIETPASVGVSDELAREVDFFCIGTNDLIQYILEKDRQDFNPDEISDPQHPAVMRAIRETIENAHAAGIWVGICGEMAADTAMTKTLVEMGVDELSVAPAALLRVREAVRQLD